MTEKKSGGLFGRLGKTRTSLSSGLFGLFKKNAQLDEQLFDDIEDAMIMADLGAEPSQLLVERLRKTAKSEKIDNAEALLEALGAGILDILAPVEQPLQVDSETRPFVILMVGVNGVGKTTTTAKLAHHLKTQGKTVMLAAADTFRAAAIEQLQSWGDQLNIPVVAQQHGSDAAAVAFDAWQSARAKNIDVLVIDTAGRQHTHGDLMEQLSKLTRVLQKIDPDLPHEVMLTIDAGTGQNALSQIEHFKSAVNVTSLCVTKLDGTAKGGIMISVAQKFGLPVRFIGVGESMNDLRPFNAQEFTAALLPASLADSKANQNSE